MVGRQEKYIYSIDPQNGVVNRYEIPEIKQPVSNLLVTESGLMYITTNEGAYEYNIGYKQLTKLPFTIPEKDNGIIFYDKYDKVWFREGNQALTYYDPRTGAITALHSPIRTQSAILKCRMPANKACSL